MVIRKAVLLLFPSCNVQQRAARYYKMRLKGIMEGTKLKRINKHVHIDLDVLKTNKKKIYFQNSVFLIIQIIPCHPKLKRSCKEQMIPSEKH